MSPWIMRTVPKFLLGGTTPNTWNFIGNMGINTIANSIFPPMYVPLSDHFGLSISPAFGFGGDGFSGGLNVSAIYQNGDFTFSNTLGFTNNYYGAYSEIGIKDFHLGYGVTYYGSYDNVGSQTVGTLKLGIDKVSFALSNDLFGEKHQDRWRTSAAELNIGKFSIGTYVITNDGQHESNYERGEEPSLLLGLNKRIAKDGKPYWAHKNGQVYYAPLWIGYKSKSQIYRIGYSHPYVQDLTQNAVHHYFKPGAAPDFVHYSCFKQTLYSYFGYYNPISLWNR